MMSQDIRNVVVLKLQAGKLASEISKNLCNVVSERTVRNWKSMYLKTGKIDWKKPPGLVRTVRTKNNHQENPKNVCNGKHVKVDEKWHANPEFRDDH